MHPISFGSDNHSAVHQQIIDSMIEVNEGYAEGYGDDSSTIKVISDIKELFGANCDVWLVLTGTGANVVALQSLMNSYHSVICCSKSHINIDECGAVQKFTQSRLIPVDTPDCKLNPEIISSVLGGRGDQHHSQKRVISISQSTEYGTLYSLSELQALAEFAHSNGLYLHIDGARLANAAAALNCSLAEMTYHIGADIISFGGTKNGMMFGEAIISFRPEITADILYYRKQATQLLSKMRYISAQFKGYLANELWRHNARHANKMAQLLADKLDSVIDVKITQKVEVNAVFVILPASIIPLLQDKYHFYIWDESRNEVRLMCSFNTKEEHINEFISDLKNLIT